MLYLYELYFNISYTVTIPLALFYPVRSKHLYTLTIVELFTAGLAEPALHPLTLKEVTLN